jgi:hypothetical protein
MFQFYDITEEQRHELNIWADSIIETNKQAMFSGKAYLLWSDRLYYQPGKDTWVDEEWWIRTAEKLFAEHKYDYEEKGTQVIPSLEILVHYFPGKYRDYSRYKIDLWLGESYHDPEYWWDLIIAACPDHPATKLLFEEHYSTWEAAFAIKLGDRKTINETKENIISDLEEGGVSCIIDYLDVLNKSIFDEIFSQLESNIIKGEVLKIAKMKLPIDPESWLVQHLILKSSIVMQWQEVIEVLSNNINYLARILCLTEKYELTEDILQWSLTDKFELTENLIFQLYPKIPFLIRSHHLDFPSLEFKLAIAWKRSQSKA